MYSFRRQPPLRIQCRLAPAPSRSNRLFVDRVADIAGGEYAFDGGRRTGRIGQQSLAYVTLLDTKTDTVAGSLNLGGSTAQSGDGYEPTGIVLTSAPTAAS